MEGGDEVAVVDDGTTVSELMTSGVIGCAPDDSVAAVVATMVENDVHAVVVMDGGQAVGVVSQTDLVLARQGRSKAEAAAMAARDVMTPGCVTCDVGVPLSEAVSLMTGRRIHRLVVTENDEPVGVLSMTDVVNRLILA